MAQTPQSHKPRKRRKLDNDAVPSSSSANAATVQTEGGRQKPAFALAALLWPTRRNVSQWTLIPLILMVVGLFRWATGFWGYSGFQRPPMHGDFEAQRHWMEVTINLPITQWYFYDLEWWGLDYPPLTAYHSWLLGKLGSSLDPSWFALYDSRGLDDPTLKIYMRATAVVSEYLVYVPAVIVFLRRYSRLEGISTWESSIALVAVLMQPATTLIDHGHFQYNTVMLGFVVSSMSSMLAGRPLWSCVFFVGALGFKQMALFYAPAVFAYLLGICITPRINPGRFLSIAIVTALSFGLLFAPFLLGALYTSYKDPTSSTDLPSPPLLQSLLPALPIPISSDSLLYTPLLQLTQSIHRIFPFARGIFEDKVANLWCFIHTFHKLHRYPSATVQRAALLATSAAITPPCFLLLLRPKRNLIPYAFAACAWAFFLCSYQVHEKNVLLPLLPMTLLLGGEGGLQQSTRAWVGFANALGAWTMFPLLKRDELRIPYFVLSLLWANLLGLPPVSLSVYKSSNAPIWFTVLVHGAFYAAMVAWHVVEAVVEPPRGKPDLWVVANVLVGAVGFGLCYLWCLWMLVVKSGIFGERKEREREVRFGGKVKEN